MGAIGLLRFRWLLWCALLLIFGGVARAQPRDINGTVKTPAGVPIMDAYLWIDPGTYGSSYYSTSLGTYTVIYMPGYANKYLRISKAGWEFSPAYYLITAATGGNLTRNFVGVPMTSLTSGMSSPGALDQGAVTYFSTNVPAGATQAEISYDGTGNATLKASLNTWPGTTALQAIHNKSTPTRKTLTLNASSTPPIAAGKWYFSVQATESTSFSLKLILRGAQPVYTVSGAVYRSDGPTTQPLSGALVIANNGGTSQTTGADGLYNVAVPYYWSGSVAAQRANTSLTPAARNYANVEANVLNANFREIVVTSQTIAAYLLGLSAPDSEEISASDLNGDSQVDIGDLVTEINR